MAANKTHKTTYGRSATGRAVVKSVKALRCSALCNAPARSQSPYAIERFLYRLSLSSHHDAFILKGALLFSVWEGSPHRPTQDLDLLGFGDRSLARLTSVFREICATPVEDDGWTFEPATVEAEDIRTVAEYGGVRVRLTGKLGGAVVRVQTDIGFGDAVTPPATNAAYPSLLGLPSPQLRAYPRETVVAEKLEAIVKLGMLNTRHKDYCDLRHLARHFDFEGGPLARAIAATFARRGTPLAAEIPVGLTAAFAQDSAKQAQWSAFYHRMGEKNLPSLPDVVAEVQVFVAAPLHAATRSEPLSSRWTRPGPWKQRSSSNIYKPLKVDAGVIVTAFPMFYSVTGRIG